MGVYNFKSRWLSKLPLVGDGTKLTTLRATRCDGRVPLPGERFIAFCGMRTKTCRRLFETYIRTVNVILIENHYGESEFEPVNYSLFKNGKLLTRREAAVLARRDGFDDLDQLIEFFESEHRIDVPHEKFLGYLIEWEPPRQTASS